MLSTRMQSAVFVPNHLPNLKLWLDAADVVTITESSGAVSQWDDKSGQGNHVTQGTGSAQPSTGVATLGGRNVISFGGNDYFNLPSGVFSSVAADNTVFVVAKRASETGSFEVVMNMRDSGLNKWLVLYSSVAGYIDFRNNNSGASSQAKTGATNTNHQVIRGRKEGALKAVTYNREAESTNSLATNVTVTSGYIGSLTGGSNFLTGEIAEIVLFDRSLSVAEYQQVTDYLAAKWNIVFV